MLIIKSFTVNKIFYSKSVDFYVFAQPVPSGCDKICKGEFNTNEQSKKSSI